MTYHREYDDPRFQGGGFSEYPSTLETRRGSAKWTVLAVVAIFAILGTFILFPRGELATQDGIVESSSQSTAPATGTTVTD